MLIEHRTYTIIPGKMGDFTKLYGGEPFQLQRKIQGNLLGYFQTESGELSQLINIWAYDSMEDRNRRRAELAKEVVWQDYLKVCTQYISRMENRFLTPTSFFSM
ncbi:NIPSNAP family protein (plasmid) [Agrobacterium leguminum]|uniref:NIPSNAP family containing protein n=1 Tax=Agrobacterium deltaense NCPPB 1641 TaxID=1183425 RepID=A0A1S7U9Q3_9HYPH|nr:MULTISPECIES: NIPSNAP family protein [Agrobacterium]WFS70109.1 NIPSNAP family protein [Agrobacterium leguminum]CVI63532.1 NIPSNAP family containing protein [Agrobacterium deltaense NCPPB 1641]